MLGNVVKQPAHHHKCGEKRHYEPHGNHRKRCCCQYVSGLPEVVNRSSENRRNRQEEREFRCRFSRQTDAKTADNSCAGAASARNHGQTLQETDLQSVFPTHVIHRFYTRFVGFLVLVILNDENNHTAHDQSCRNRDRIKEPFFYVACNQYADHCSGKESNNRIDG